MSEIEIFICIIVGIMLYIFIGTIVELIIDRERMPVESSSIITGIVFWPVLLIILIIIGIGYLPYKLAKWILVQLHVIEDYDD